MTSTETGVPTATRPALAPWLRVALAMTAVGWGANQFASLLAVYRADGHTDAFVSFAVGVYAAGLVLTLFAVAVVGDRVGHRAFVRAGVLAAVAGTLLIMLGAEFATLVPVGRFVAGAATGLVLAPGTAWLMELSRSTPGAGPRRATIALSVGFGGGPTVAGLVGQWAAYPEVVPYTLHLALSAVAIVLVWAAPTPAVAHTGGAASWRGVGTTLRSPIFLRTVLPTAPWVFGTAATAFAIAPTVVTVTRLPVAAGAVVTGLALSTGIALQPLAKRAEARVPGQSLRLGMLVTTLAMLLGALTFTLDATVLLFVLAPALGAGYGLLLVGGLRRVEATSTPADLTRVNAVFYALTYIGFAMPSLFVALTAELFSPTAVMLAGAAIAALTLVQLPRQLGTPAPETAAVE